MPTYEYICRACDHRFERFQKISASPVRTCPECGKRRVERLISSGGGLVFKGPGFYATDYRKGGPASGSSDEGGSKAGEGGSKAGEGGSKSGEAGSGSGKGAGDAGGSTGTDAKSS